MTTMARPLLPEWKDVALPVIGMVHLQALCGSPRFGGDMRKVRDAAIHDAEALVAGGVHALMLENFGDAPFFPGRVPAHVVSQMTALATNIRRRWPHVPLGLNVLRNDGQSALAIAPSVGAAFIRVNVLCGARVTDQGLIQGIAHDLQRYRVELGAQQVRIMADVDVKHSSPLGTGEHYGVADQVADTIERGLADAVIVSGPATGKAAKAEQIKAVKQAAGATPVFVGSGVSVHTLAELAPHCDGLIVGTALKRDGVTTNPVDARRVEEFVNALHAVTGSAA